MKKRWFKNKKVPPIHFLQFSLLVILGAFAYIEPNRLIIHIFLLVLIVCILDGIHFFAMQRKMMVDINGGQPVEKNETYIVKVKFSNHANLPSSFFHVKFKESQRLKLKGKDELSIFLEPKGHLSFELAYEAKLSGQDMIGIEFGNLDSFFGFFRVHVPLEMYIKARILPQIRSISEIGQFAHTLLGEDSNEYNASFDKHIGLGEEVGYDLKPYQEGDSQRLIHWKLAALKESYFVRQREGANEQRQDIYFILCPLQQEEDEEELAIIQDKTVTSLVSMAYYFLSNEQIVKVACYIHKSWKYMKLESLVQIRELQELLSKYQSVKMNEKVDEKQIIKSLMKIWREHEGIKVLLSAYWDDRVQGALLEEEAKSYIPVIWTGSLSLVQVVRQETLPVWYIHEDYRIERIQ